MLVTQVPSPTAPMAPEPAPAVSKAPPVTPLDPPFTEVSIIRT